MSLPEYDSLGCAKCGEPDKIKKLYMAERTTELFGMYPFQERLLPEPIPEHMLRTCEVCGYDWMEAPRDA